MSHDLRERFRQVGKDEVALGVDEHDAQHTFDRDAWRRVGARGLFKLLVPRPLGGEGLGLRDFAAAVEGFALGSRDLGFSVSVVAHAGCLIPALCEFGTPEQQAKYLPRLMSGEWLGSIANAEPHGGTDVMSLKSRATRLEGDAGFVLSARKRSITNLGDANLVLATANLGHESMRAISTFLVETTNDRVRQRRIRDLMGLRTSPTGDFIARAARLPPDALLGRPGGGVRFFKYVFTLERLLIGHLYLASLQRSLERAVHHAESREVFGEALGRNQYVQDKVVRMRTSLELLKAQLEHTMTAYLAGEDVTTQLSIIKGWGAESARHGAEDLLTLLGGRGMRKSQHVEKDVRDLMGLSILGGTWELQKMVIYRETVRALAPRPVDVEVVPFAEVNETLSKALVGLVERAMPGTAVVGRYFYDTPPDYLVLARVDGQLVGYRMLCRRQVPFKGRMLNVAGLGIAVLPGFQRRGIGRRLTEETLALSRALGDELALAFLVTQNAEPLLSRFRFRQLEAQVSYEKRATGVRTIEEMPCFALGLTDDAVLLEVEEQGQLHLGVGTW